MGRARLEESLVVWNELGDKEGTGEALTRSGQGRSTSREHHGSACPLRRELWRLMRDTHYSEIATCLEGLAGVVAAQGELAGRATLGRSRGAP